MVNEGREPHQAVIAGANDRSWEELETAMKMAGPIPAWLTFPAARRPAVFVGPDVGKTGWFTVTLTPGNYLLTCHVPDVKDGKPHVAYGMVKEITVS